MVTESRQMPGELLAAISNMVVGVYADCLGRGPTRARSYIDQNVVLCILEDTLTKPERHLQQAGREERLLDLRITLQETMHEALTTGMELLLKREVRALISGSQLDPDIASEVFVLGEAQTADKGETGAAAALDGGNGQLEEQPIRREAV